MRDNSRTIAGESEPIDFIEDLAMECDWVHTRSSEDQITMEIDGDWGDYRLTT